MRHTETVFEIVDLIFSLQRTWKTGNARDLESDGRG